MKHPQSNSMPARPPFPPDDEIRAALLESSMSRWAVRRALSQILRLPRWDFGGRRKRRLYNVAAMRMGGVLLKEKVAAIATRHDNESGVALNADDFVSGAYQYLLMDFGIGDVERAIKELVREGILRAETRVGIQVLKPTRKPFRYSINGLRQALDQMKLHLGIRYAQEYNTERTYRM